VTKIASLFLVLVLAFSIARQASAADCSIRDVIDFIDDGLSASDIRKECGPEGVIGAGNCSLSTIIRMARNGADEREIRSECRSTRSRSPRDDTIQTPRVATFCQTNFGACPLTFGPAVPINGPCYCVFPNGSAPGVGR
jgi:hypothetical protein